MHFLNMYLFHRIRRRAELANLPPPALHHYHLGGPPAAAATGYPHSFPDPMPVR